MRRYLALAVLLLLALSPAPARAAEAQDQTPLEQIDWGQTPEYRIVPGDELALNFGPGQIYDTDIVRKVIVRTDGRITVFPVGDVVAAGHTPAELQAELVRLLAGEMKQPRIVVEVAKSAGNQIHVLGRVKRPGSVPVTSIPTLLQVLAEAGGFEDDAATNSVVVMHRIGLGTVSVARIRADRLLRKGGDVPLSRFDIVYVPRTAIGNLDVFTRQFAGSLARIGSVALVGWELFHLDRIFQVVGTSSVSP